jgi:hypothetical protein
MRLTLAVVAVALTIGMSGCSSSDSTASPLPGSSKADAGGATSSQAFNLNDGELFTPESADEVHPSLSATGAWVTYATQNHARINRDHVPPGTTSELGVFTDGGGRQHIAYVYLTPNSYPELIGTVRPDPPVPCTQWLTLNANTGEMIESSWFRCPKTHYVSVLRPPREDGHSG